MNTPQFVFGCDVSALKSWLMRLKEWRCPFCECSKSLNRHSFLYGNDPDCPNGRRLRGQRVFCSDRGQRGGCGRSFPVFLADVLPRFTVGASLLWRLLGLLLDGGSVLSAIDSLSSPFAPQTFYHLLGRLRLRLDFSRMHLCQAAPVPQSSQSDPLLQTVEHFKSAFERADCPLSEFQTRFQKALFG
jgi:hypothetical protein